jgi:hypothetical protein
MAVLSDQDRKDIWAKWMQDNTEGVTITKQDVRAAVDAVDAWVDANQTSYNNAIPQPARGALTTDQKARILMEVVTRRFIVP